MERFRCSWHFTFIREKEVLLACEEDVSVNESKTSLWIGPYPMEPGCKFAEWKLLRREGKRMVFIDVDTLLSEMEEDDCLQLALYRVRPPIGEVAIGAAVISLEDLSHPSVSDPAPTSAC